MYIVLTKGKHPNIQWRKKKIKNFKKKRKKVLTNGNKCYIIATVPLGTTEKQRNAGGRKKLIGMGKTSETGP